MDTFSEYIENPEQGKKVNPASSQDRSIIDNVYSDLAKDNPSESTLKRPKIIKVPISYDATKLPKPLSREDKQWKNMQDIVDLRAENPELYNSFVEKGFIVEGDTPETKPRKEDYQISGKIEGDIGIDNLKLYYQDLAHFATRNHFANSGERKTAHKEAEKFAKELQAIEKASKQKQRNEESDKYVDATVSTPIRF